MRYPPKRSEIEFCMERGESGTRLPTIHPGEKTGAEFPPKMPWRGISDPLEAFLSP